MFKAIAAALTRDDPPPAADAADGDATASAAEPISIAQRNELHIQSIVCEEFDDISVWYASIKQRYLQDHGLTGSADSENGDAAVGPTSGSAGDNTADSGPCYVIQLSGYHYHNEDQANQAKAFVRNTLLKELKDGSVNIGGDANQPIRMKDLGIKYPVLVRSSDLKTVSEPNRAELAKQRIRREAAASENPRGNEREQGRETTPEVVIPDIPLERHEFTVQFCWQPTSIADRKQMADDRRAAKEEAAKLAAANAADSDGGSPGLE